MIFKYKVFLILPFIFLYFLLKKNNTRAIPYSDISHLKKISPTLKAKLRNPILKTLLFLFFSLLALAAARPHTSKILPSPKKARNLMLALDISGSMQTGDFSIAGRTVSRLDAVKHVVKEFISKRPEDRIGLVVFGTQGYLECPLTNDHQILVKFVENLRIGAAGRGTAIGDGLGLSLKRLEAVPGESKAVILLTDGVDTSGNINPDQAANVAKEFKIKIHTIGIGSSETARHARRGFFSNSSKSFEFDEKLLKKLANLSGGIYFNAKDIEELKKVYQEIDKLEKTEKLEPSKKIIQEKFAPFALSALISYLLYLFLANTFFLKVP